MPEPKKVDLKEEVRYLDAQIAKKNAQLRMLDSAIRKLSEKRRGIKQEWFRALMGQGVREVRIHNDGRDRDNQRVVIVVSFLTGLTPRQQEISVTRGQYEIKYKDNDGQEVRQDLFHELLMNNVNFVTALWNLVAVGLFPREGLKKETLIFGDEVYEVSRDKSGQPQVEIF